MSVICWFKELSLKDTELVGGKGANLGELTRVGIPVPPGFVVTAEAFRAFLDATGLRETIFPALASLDVEDSTALQMASEQLRSLVLTAPLPESLRVEISSAYARLLGGDSFVAVRSSATVEDMPGTSFAGMNETYLNVRRVDDLLDAVQHCWASLYGARVLYYRRKQNIAEEAIAIAVVVQQMADSESSGVMFTVNPATGDRNEIVIEGAFGLGETVVSGSVSPDHWEVAKDTLKLTNERLAIKHIRMDRIADGSNLTRSLPDDEGRLPCLTHDQVLRVATLGRQIEEHYGVAQDIEWALVGSELFIVQSRPVTAIGGTQTQGETLVRGLGAAPGIGAGVARVLLSMADADRLRKGEVLVARKTEPDWVPLMKRASAIVTDEGGMTAHAAIVSRELGIPCVVGTQDATRRIADGLEITVDARQGIVYRCRLVEEKAPLATTVVAAPSAPITGTRLYVNLGQPDKAEEVAARDVDGIGLARMEFIFLAVTNNVHPRKLLEEGHGDALRDGLAESLARFARAFAPRPVVARTSDFRTNEYRGMTGGAAYEPEEENPMIGYRGVYRYVKEPDLFRCELEAFKKVRDEMGLKNLILMLPFVRTLSELQACKRLMTEVGLFDDPAFPWWIMAEVPSVVYRLEEYVKEGITGVSIGSNDLTQLVLGLDRDSSVLAPLFDERDPAVLGALQQIVTTCRRLGITCSICGQGPSVYPELTEKLVMWGIDSISVNPDVLERTRRVIAAAEQRILLQDLRRRQETAQ